MQRYALAKGLKREIAEKEIGFLLKGKRNPP
jgi:hypothetical protein